MVEKSGIDNEGIDNEGIDNEGSENKSEVAVESDVVLMLVVLIVVLSVSGGCRVFGSMFRSYIVTRQVAPSYQIRICLQPHTTIRQGNLLGRKLSV